jgi:hypothetical protein
MRTQRRSTIGAWQNCFEFLSFASVFTNCFLLALVSSHIGSVIPLSNQEFLETDWGRYISHTLFRYVAD